MDKSIWVPNALQIEDALLFIWLVLVTPALQFVFGSALSGLNLGNINRDLPNSLWLGILFVVSTLLAIGCTLTRAPNETQRQGSQASGEELISGTPFGYAHLPMLAGTGIMLFLGLDLLGFGDAAMGLLCLLFGSFIVVGVIYNRMPVVDYSLRRILMTPFILLTTSIFTSTINPIFANVDTNGLFQIVQSDLGRFEFGLLLAGVLVYYLMFVFAPRQIAGSGGGWLQWAARFALYLVGLILNIRLLQGV